jgi:hypothetical protein
VAAVSALARRPRLPAHVAVEAFSVLTRLPPPHRAPADLVERSLRERFPEPLLPLPPEAHRALLGLAVRTGLARGVIYDALLAITAKRALASLPEFDTPDRD